MSGGTRRSAADHTWRSHLEVHTRQGTETSRCFEVNPALGIIILEGKGGDDVRHLEVHLGYDGKAAPEHCSPTRNQSRDRTSP